MLKHLIRVTLLCLYNAFITKHLYIHNLIFTFFLIINTEIWISSIISPELKIIRLGMRTVTCLSWVIKCRHRKARSRTQIFGLHSLLQGKWNFHGQDSHLILISAIVYIQAPVCIPVGSRLFTCWQSSTQSELSVMEVCCRTSRGETNKHLDLMGQAPASHHRDRPREFYPVCGSREESPGAQARKREGQRCAGSRSNRREWRWSHQQRQHLGSRGCSQAQERACSLYTPRWQPQEWGLVWVPV